MTHDIRHPTFAAFREEIDAITQSAVDRGLGYAITAIRRENGEWSATITVEDAQDA